MCLTLSKYIFYRSKVLWENHSIENFLSQKSCISRHFTGRPNKSSEATSSARPNKRSEATFSKIDISHLQLCTSGEKKCFKIAQNLLYCSLSYIYKHIGTPKFLVKVLIFFSPKSCISRHFSGRPNKSSDFRGNFFKNRCMSFVAMYLSPQLVLTNIR